MIRVGDRIRVLDNTDNKRKNKPVEGEVFYISKHYVTIKSRLGYKESFLMRDFDNGELAVEVC